MDVDRGEHDVTKHVAEDGRAAARTLFRSSVGDRAVVGVVERFAQALAEAGEIGCAHHLAAVAGRRYAVAGDNADAEGAAVVLAAELVHPVLGDPNLALPHLDAHVRVAAAALDFRVGRNEVEHSLAQLPDDVDGDLAGHAGPPAGAGREGGLYGAWGRGGSVMRPRRGRRAVP